MTFSLVFSHLSRLLPQKSLPSLLEGGLVYGAQSPVRPKESRAILNQETLFLEDPGDIFKICPLAGQFPTKTAVIESHGDPSSL